MAANIFQQKKPVGSTPRNPFDGTASRVFSMRPSVTRASFIQHTTPNSSYRINVADIVRTTSLQKAAFLRGKQEMDFYFVPYSLLYTPANNVVMSRGDTVSPALNVDTANFPMVGLAYLFNWACLPYFAWRFYLLWKEKIVGPWNDQTSWSTSLCGWLHAYVSPGSAISDYEKNFYLKICFYDDFLDKDNADSFNPSSLHWVGADVFHLLAACGYSDQYLLFKWFFDRYANGTNTATYSAAVNSVYSGLYVKYVQAVINYCFVSRENNLLNLVAYQKVWYDNYRDSVNDNSFVYEVASSYDAFSTYWKRTPQLCINSSVSDEYIPLLTYLRPRLRMYERDLSCGLYASPQDTTFGYGDADDASTRGVAYEAGGSDPLSAYSMKFAFAMQKYSEMLLKAGIRTKDILRAEFGVRSQYIDEHYSRFLGSFSGSLNMNTVQATADSGTYSVGDLAGNVFSSLQGDTIEFTCEDYGIIIGVLSFVAKPLHNAFGVDKFTEKQDTFDFYHEAFANLGLVPVGSELFSLFSPDNRDFTLGFTARDFEYKQNLDLVFGSFCTSPLAKGFIDSVIGAANNTHIPNGSNSNYVLVRPIAQTMSTLKSRIYLMPDVFDTVFTVQDSQIQDSEHFDVALDVQCSKIMPMPVMGMI